jgi:hypothetical protein
MPISAGFRKSLFFIGSFRGRVPETPVHAVPSQKTLKTVTFVLWRPPRLQATFGQGFYVLIP